MMSDTNGIDAIAISAFRTRIIEILPAQIHHCVDELNEEQLWWRPNDHSNSVGNLVLHLSGSTRHYLCRSLGGFEYNRDRPAEFAEQGPIPKQELLAILDETIRQAAATLDSFDPSRFSGATEQPDYYPSIFDQILGVATHVAIHTGQIVYITKMLKAGAIDELWMKVYKLK